MSRYIQILVFLFITHLSPPLGAREIHDRSYFQTRLEQADSLSKLSLDSALVLYKQIANETEQAGYQKLKWDAKLNEGTTYSDLGERDSALTILQTTLKDIVANKDTIYQIKALTKLGGCYSDNYEFEQAINHLVAAQKLLNSTSPFDLRFNVLNTLGQAHKKMKDYSSALTYYGQLANEYFYQLDDLEKFFVYMNTGNVYAEINDLESAEELYLKAYSEIQKLDEPENLALITYNLGNLYFKQGKYSTSIEYAQKALERYTNIGKQSSIELANRLLGAIQYRLGNYRRAENYYFTALEIARDIQNPNSIKANYKNLFSTYRQMARANSDNSFYEKALDYQGAWSELNDSLYQQNLADRVLELEKKYETDKKNAQIELLGKENQLKADELLLERQNQKFMMVVIGLLVMIMGVVLYFMVYYRRVNAQLKRQSQLIFEQKEQISSQNVQLQKAINTQNKLFGIIAHDLRSPLVSVSNFVRLLNFYIRDGRYDSITRMAKEMDRKNEQVLELTDNLLNWARSQSGGLKTRMERFSLNEILDQCYQLYLPIAERKEIQLRLLDGNDCQLWADRDMVRTICRNLVNNALKFTPQEGTVTISYSCEGNNARISVRDTGMGISPDRQKRLFNVSKEDVRYGTDGEKSSGLGLSVCKEFCDILQGKIEVESTEDVGSTFSFTIPLYSDELRELTEWREAAAKINSL
ncbi:ATP-binding protein [Mangrovibacterium diazotrophicum]|uniref:histidine kinase n=1 Tax=Mangrovibacterium diazotrophicum TaxID=1261403 RepID=A0A419W682_9BACT|nr:tetratricopeptide repeat protein [Mangrovibacterium diazotrophicum]RKD90983.1 signal transduction histidine kinase [Mangrovibacterium diazotrophicum]